MAGIFQEHGTETRVVVGLANWGSENILLEDSPLKLLYVKDHGEGFVPLRSEETDDRIVFPGTMALLEIDPQGQEEGFFSVDLQGGGEILITWEEEPDGNSGTLSGAGDSSGCSATGVFPLQILFALPFIRFAVRKK